MWKKNSEEYIKEIIKLKAENQIYQTSLGVGQEAKQKAKKKKVAQYKDNVDHFVSEKQLMPIKNQPGACSMS